MSDVLKPIQEYPDAEYSLAAALYDYVHTNQDQLLARNFHGPVCRYGQDLVTAQTAIRSALHGVESTGAHIFVVQDEEANPRGLATIYPGLPLTRMRLPVPRKAGRLPLTGKKLPWANPNIAAWTADDENQDLLAAAYKELVFRAGKFTKRGKAKLVEEKRSHVWTIEPVSSPQFIHSAIEKAGLRKVREGRYDDREARPIVPSKSVLYVDTRGLAQNEVKNITESVVRKGRPGLGMMVLAGMDDRADEMVSWNPKG